METFIGKPHVYTIDVNNLELVESTVKEILSSEVKIKVSCSFSLVLGRTDPKEIFGTSRRFHLLETSLTDLS